MTLLTTARLFVRPYCLADADLLGETLDRNRQHLVRFLPGEAGRSYDRASMVGRIRRFRREAAAGTHWHFVLVSRADPGVIVGGIGLSGDGELGFWLIESAQGRGLATEGASAVLDFAAREHGVAQIRARTAKDNLRSAAVLERLGFEREADGLSWTSNSRRV